MFGVQGFVEFLKSLAKLGFAILVLVIVLSDDHRRLLAGMITNPVAFGSVIRSIAVDILTAIVFVMGADCRRRLRLVALPLAAGACA